MPFNAWSFTLPTSHRGCRTAPCTLPARLPFPHQPPPGAQQGPSPGSPAHLRLGPLMTALVLGAQRLGVPDISQQVGGWKVEPHICTNIIQNLGNRNMLQATNHHISSLLYNLALASPAPPSDNWPTMAPAMCVPWPSLLSWLSPPAEKYPAIFRWLALLRP